MVYSIASRLLPTKSTFTQPQRIVLIRPCCIGDVVMATGALSALRETYPDAHITWAVGSWSARAVEHHSAINAILDTGSADLPVRSLAELMSFVNQLRAGRFDMVVSLVRSPLMSLAVLLSGIPIRVGLDSAGRGFGYNMRVPINPDDRKHEGDIYLKVIQAIAGKPLQSYANLPLLDSAKIVIQSRLASADITQPYIVAHPGGGSNPGMQMDSKRYPLPQLADMLNQLSDAFSATLILIGGPKDGELVDIVQQHLIANSVAWVGDLSFAEIGTLAQSALFYIGNDTGLTHVASASGANTVMMMGPSDPKLYAPFTADHLVLWKPIELHAGGVASAHQKTWDWGRDGFTVDDGIEQITNFIRNNPYT
jgi:ADP-heptose:LPS heptosyltransferase